MRLDGERGREGWKVRGKDGESDGRTSMIIDRTTPAEMDLPSVNASTMVMRIGPIFFSTDTIGTVRSSRAQLDEYSMAE